MLGGFRDSDLKSYATAVGLDREAFDDCRDSGRIQDLVRCDWGHTQNAGARSTPTFPNNTRQVFPTYNAMTEAIDHLQRSLGQELFMPFCDVTSGPESYGSVRYLDTSRPGIRRLPDGKQEVDFNCAYNPFCSYSPYYSCPLPPQENWLKVPIRAGEKKYL